MQKKKKKGAEKCLSVQSSVSTFLYSVQKLTAALMGKTFSLGMSCLSKEPCALNKHGTNLFIIAVVERAYLQSVLLKLKK